MSNGEKITWWMIKYPPIKKNAQLCITPAYPGSEHCKSTSTQCTSDSKNLHTRFLYPVLPISLSMHMLLRFFQTLCGLLACIMCICILGPIAMIIESGRVLRSAVRLEPIIWTRWLRLLPQFAVCCGLIVCMALLLGTQS